MSVDRQNYDLRGQQLLRGSKQLKERGAPVISCSGEPTTNRREPRNEPSS